MTAATIPQAVRMRPVASTDDSLAASEILTLWIGNEPEKIEVLVPGGSTFDAVAIAEDESMAIFDVYAGAEWDATKAEPLTRIAISR